MIAHPMFDHVTLRVADLDASARFYTTVLDTLGVPRLDNDIGPEWENDLSLARADAEHPVTRNLHLGFFAPAHDEVRGFWRPGSTPATRTTASPGPGRSTRPSTSAGSCAIRTATAPRPCTCEDARRRGQLDHLWIRVADVAAARDFYAAIAPYAGIRLNHDTPELAQFQFSDGSFSLVAGTPTENVHLAFGTDDDAAVEGFHATATALGYADHGAPGERPEYHPGYFAAFVLDPDGNNVELVNHHR